MNSRLRLLTLVAVLALALVLSAPSFGQVLKGSISGIVSDPQGAIVSGATVKATNVGTGLVYVTTSDSAGLFRFSLIPVGHYKTELTAQRFKTAVVNKVEVSAGQDAGLGKLQLTIGDTSSTVEIILSTPLLPTTEAQVADTISGVTLRTFAGIQENQGLDKLALFVPGVSNSRSDNFSNINGTGFSVNGLRGRNNDQLIDGQTNNDNTVGGPDLIVADSEFVQQYVITTNQFGPEYGRNSGSVVNLITKSGTNNWHGSIYGSESNSYLNALSNFQKTVQNLEKPPRSNEEFTGFTIGGPVLKNRLHIFGGFDDDILSRNQVYSSSSLSPTPAGLATLAACAGVSANSLNVITRFGPYGISVGNPTPIASTITTRMIDGCTVQFAGVSRTLPNPSHQFNWIGRADLRVGNDTISTRYIYNHLNSFNNGDNGAGGWVFNQKGFNQQVLASWTHNFNAHMVNEARVSYGRLNSAFGGNNISNPFEPTVSNIGDALANIGIGGGFLGIGPSTNIPQGRIVNTWQAQDNWNYIRGKHSFKAGANWTYQKSPNTFLPDFNGRFAFTSFTNFINNVPNSVSISQGQTKFAFSEHDVFLYAGDDWKIKQNLVINLGLTWSNFGTPSNLFNQLTTERESNPATAFWNPALPLSVRTVSDIPAIRTNFGPAVGFAYSPQWGGFLTGHGKTVFRGGYRLLYDPPFYNMFLNIDNSAPTVLAQTLTGAQAIANPLPAVPTGPNVRAELAPFITPGVFDPRLFTATKLSPDFGPDKVHSWSLGFERELGRNTVLEVRYAGNHAYNLYQATNGNPFIRDLKTDFPALVPSGLVPCAPANAFNPVAIGRVNCNEGVQRTYTNSGYSNYHALQVEFRANNLFKQLTLRTGYTFSKNLDNVSEIFSTNGAGNTNAFSQNPSEPGRPEYGISGLNFPQTWNIMFVEQLPFFKGQKGLVGHTLGGWSVAGNYILSSGQPYTPSQLGEASRTASGNYYDTAFLGQYVTGDVARPFLGSRAAPADQVGVFAGDVCKGFFGITPANNPALPGVCNTALTPVTQLVSFNALNVGGFLQGVGTVPGQVPVFATSSTVRFIVNGGTAQSIFGTPFGNAPRNSVSDARENTFNLSIFKEFNILDRARFEIHATTINLFNHFNFANIDPFVQNAGLHNFGQGFANPTLQNANGRVLTVSGKLMF